ncbi:MAG: hypothetical protein ABIV51_05795, partial [Saprospiraceae bacterium]
MQEEHIVDNQEEQGPKRKRVGPLRLLMRFLAIIITFIFAFVTAFYFTIQIPAVQFWLGQRAATKLSKVFGTEVKVESMELSLFNRFDLKNLLIRDQQKDTLLFAGNLGIEVKLNAFELLYKRFNISKLYLSDAYIAMTQDTGAIKTNLDFILNQFVDNAPVPTIKTGKSTVFISAEEILLQRVRFDLKDKKHGQQMKAS